MPSTAPQWHVAAPSPNRRRWIIMLGAVVLFFLALSLVVDVYDRASLLMDPCVQFGDGPAESPDCDEIVWTTQSKESLLSEYTWHTATVVTTIVLVVLAFVLKQHVIAWIALGVAATTPFAWGPPYFFLAYFPVVAALIPFAILLMADRPGVRR